MLALMCDGCEGEDQSFFFISVGVRCRRWDPCVGDGDRDRGRGSGRPWFLDVDGVVARSDQRPKRPERPGRNKREKGSPRDGRPGKEQGARSKEPKA